MKHARTLLAALSALAVATGLCACGSSSSSCGPDAGPRAAPDGGSDAGADGGDAAVPDAGPPGIDHLVIVVLESHSFDNMFATFPGAEGLSHFTDSSGTFDAPHAPDALPRDLCRTRACQLAAWDGGGMDGWEQVPGENVNGDHLAWAQYQEGDIPAFWSYAQHYGLGDHFFTSALASSFPGHLFLLAGQANWVVDDPTVGGVNLPLWGCDDPSLTSTNEVHTLGTVCTTLPAVGAPCFDIPSGPDVLAPGVSWKFYGSALTLQQPFPLNAVWTAFDAVKRIRQTPANWAHVVGYDQEYDQDVDFGTLPNVSWLVSQDQYSGHPPLQMCLSDSWVAQKVNRLMLSGAWSRSAVLITWDHPGGFYDHVPPPNHYGCDSTHPYGLGFRVPLIIVSPWVKQGVFHQVVEQASIVRLIEELFGNPGAVGSLHAQSSAARDDVAPSLLPLFDFTQAPLPAALAKESCP